MTQCRKLDDHLWPLMTLASARRFMAALRWAGGASLHVACLAHAHAVFGCNLGLVGRSGE